MKTNRTLIISALLASLGPLVGNGLYSGLGGSGEAVLAEAREGVPTVVYVSHTLELVGFVALAVLFAWLVTFLLESSPVAAVATGVAGSATLAVKLGSVAPVMVVRAMAETLDPVTAEVLVSLNSQAFVVSGFLMSTAFLAAGTGLLATEFPGWLAWWAALAGGLGVVAGVVGVLRPDDYVPIPFLLLLLWMLAVALTTVMRPGHARPRIRGNRAFDQVPATD